MRSSRLLRSFRFGSALQTITRSEGHPQPQIEKTLDSVGESRALRLMHRQGFGAFLKVKDAPGGMAK